MLFAIVARRLHRLKWWHQRRSDCANVTAQPGDLLTLPEPDYQYGVGPLRLRVELVDRAHPMVYEGENWYPVDGVQLSSDGKELGSRHVLVRGSRLRG